MIDEPRTFDLRLWVTADPPGPALEAFFADVLDLARMHDGIEARWINERRDRLGRPSIRRPRPRRGTGGGAGSTA